MLAIFLNDDFFSPNDDSFQFRQQDVKLKSGGNVKNATRPRTRGSTSSFISLGSGLGGADGTSGGDVSQFVLMRATDYHCDEGGNAFVPQENINNIHSTYTEKTRNEYSGAATKTKTSISMKLASLGTFMLRLLRLSKQPVTARVCGLRPLATPGPPRTLWLF